MEEITFIGEDVESPEELKTKLQPDWVNEPTIEDLKNDLTSAQSDHDAQVNVINDYLDRLHVRNAYKIPKSDTNSSTQPKLIRKQAEWRKSALSEPFLSTEDIFNISPVTAEDVDAAKQNELVLNNQFNTKLNKVKLIDDYIQTAVHEGTIIVRVGWETAQKVTEIEQFDPETNTIMIVEQVETVKNQPTVDVCNYSNIVIDPTCEGDIDKAQFVIYSFETTLSELEESGLYSNLNKIQVDNAQSPLGSPDDHKPGNETISMKFRDEPRKKIIAYEYWGFWDIDGTGITKPIVATWVGSTLIRMEENPFPDQELPFVVVQYLPVERSIYGEPDGALIVDNQQNYGALLRGSLDTLARSANGQRGMRKDLLDTANKRKFNKGLDYEFNIATDPRQGIIEHVYPELPASAFNLLNFQQQEADALTGVRPFQDTQNSTSTVQPRGILDAASKRENAILRRLSEGMKKVGRKIIAMNAEFLDDEETIRITNKEFVPVRRDDLAGNFDLRINISTVEADNDKANQLEFMMQTMGNTVPLPFSQMVLAEIAQLRKMPDLALKIQNFQPEPPSEQEQMLQQLQMENLYLTNEKLKSEINENYVQTGLLNAKTATEGAKAAESMAKSQDIMANADLKNLEFMETQGGITHARNVDRVQAQAQAQTKMKIVEHGLQKLKLKND